MIDNFVLTFQERKHMLELQQHTGKLKCENYGLYEFLLDVQNGVNQGYEIDDSNEGFPQVYGSLYTCLLKNKATVVFLDKQAEISAVLTIEAAKDVLPEETIVAKQETELKQEVTPDAELVIKRGPKPKNK